MSMELGVMSNQFRLTICVMCSQVREHTPKKLGVCDGYYVAYKPITLVHVSCLCSLKWNLFIDILV